MLRERRAFATLLMSVVAFFFFGCEKNKTQKPLVAITQIIEHKSLDEERKGLLEGLKEGGYVDGQNIEILFENAQGNIATATQIASKFQSLNPAVVVAISTPSAQAVVGALKQTQIPVVFSAVTNPVEAKLVSKHERGRKENVTGITDALQARPQVMLVKRIVPDAKTVGIIYNPGEQNSVTSVAEFIKEAKGHGLEVIESTASKTSDVAAAAQNLAGKVQAIYVPNDNTAVAAMKSIVSTCEKIKIPVFAGDVGSFDDGVVAVAAYDRFILGKKVADYVIRILKGADPKDIPVSDTHAVKMHVNLRAAKAMGLELNKEDLQGFNVIE